MIQVKLIILKASAWHHNSIKEYSGSTYSDRVPCVRWHWHVNRQQPGYIDFGKAEQIRVKNRKIIILHVEGI